MLRMWGIILSITLEQGCFMWKFLKTYFIVDYTSELDQFLQDFSSKNPVMSHNQSNEIERCKQISQLRDHKHDKE